MSEKRNAVGKTASFLRRLPQKERMGRPLKLVLWLGAGGFVVFVLLLGDGGWLRVAGLQSEVEELQAQLRTLDQQQTELREELEDLSRPGSPTLERVARERYGMHAPGERVVHILGTRDESLAPKPPSLIPGPEIPPSKGES